MKKYLVVLLALVMVLAFAATSLADDTRIPDYTDVKADTPYACDIYRLTALGVLQGNNGWGGAYRPAEYLTRAEFAKIAIYMFGAEDTVSYYASLKSSFSDVAEGFWAEGYINAALDLGLMKGRGNGIFDPNSTVTTQEVATVVLRAVGYTDELPGAWPTDYITKAANVSSWKSDDTLFKHAQFIGPNAATRGEMAAIVNYALDLYKVQYVGGNYTLVYGIGDADVDGYAYSQWKTNEENYFDGIMAGFGKIVKNVTVLYNVFNCVEVPMTFATWDGVSGGTYDKLAEASGWGYEDFEKGELQFNLYGLDESYVEMPVAKDYYIFDADLWEVASRGAYLTLAVTEKPFDSEVVYVEPATKVEYVTDGTKAYVLNTSWSANKEAIYNGNIYTDDFTVDDWNADPYAYDYDLYAEMPFAVVAKVASDMVTLHGDAAQIGEFGDELCVLDTCKKHDLQYVVLKDGKLTDGKALAVNDILYYAGTLEGDDDVVLYIAYSPMKATFEEIDSTGKTGVGEMTISGKDFNYVAKSYGALMSDDNGDNFIRLHFDYLREILKDKDYDNSVLFTEAYAKTWVGSMIFGYVENKTTYGVVTDIDEAVKSISGTPTSYYKSITIFDGTGKETTYPLDETLKVGVDYLNCEIGDLITFVIDDEEIVADSIGVATGSFGRYDGYRVVFNPGAEFVLQTNAKGVLKAGYGAVDTYVNGVAATNSFDGYKIADDAVVFVLTTDGGDFDEVELGKASDYIGVKTYVAQFAVLDPADSTIDVLYVVDPDTTVTTGYGLLTNHRTKSSGEYVTIDGKEYQVALDYAKYALEDKELYYVGYTIEKGKVSRLINGNPNYGPKVLKGDVVVLVDAEGFGFKDSSMGTSYNQVKAILGGIVDDYENVAYITNRADLEDYTFATDCKWYDMTGEFDDFNSLTDVNHDGGDFDYIIVYDDYDEIAMIFAVNYAG